MKTRDTVDQEDSKSPIRSIAGKPSRLFAVGDIHGHADEVGVLLDYLVDRKGCSSDDQVIFMGDYIDRGSSSNLVIKRMLEVQREWPKTVFLRGNHEQMLLSFLGFGGFNGEFYIRNGGATFFKSYGIDGLGSLTAMRNRIPEAHLGFLQQLELGVSLGDFIFVHAGLSPEAPLDQQREEDLLWIREEFVRRPHSFGKTVVFGHTAFNQIFLDLPYRIGIDTGVAYGNKLSAVELVHGEVYQVEVGARVVRESLFQQLLPPKA
jgi:serine/threonine protein phosphatase 1